MKNHIEYLGHKAKDRVTGFKGVVTSVSFDLYGCVQAVLTPPMIDNNQGDGRWFDIARLDITSKNRVMEIPEFTINYSDKKDEKEKKNKNISTGKKGPADKPIPSRS